jgi:short-subunit dehydrogenase
MPAKENRLVEDPVCLITGANGGLGRAFATEFAQNGYRLVLSVRKPESVRELVQELEQEYPVEITVLQADLAKPDGASDLFKQIKVRKIGVDVLVNNAGFATYGEFFRNDLETDLEEIQVNVLALVELCHRFGADMARRRSGRILNVSSTAAFQPGPLMAVYYASKAFVLHFSEALGNELKPFGVRVTALCPGPTRTGFQSRAKMHGARIIREGRLMDPAVVARAGYNGLMNNKTIVVPGLRNYLGTLAPRLVPRGSVVQFMRYVQERKKKVGP